MTDFQIREIKLIQAADRAGDVDLIVNTVLARHECGTIEELASTNPEAFDDLVDMVTGLVDQLPPEEL